MSLLIDLSHPVVEGMETYRPLPTPWVEVLNDYDASRYDGKSEFLIASLHLCGNTGTYVDSPRHRFRDGVDLAGLSLTRLADLPVVVADVTAAGRAIGRDAMPTGDLHGKALLVRTEFSRHWGSDTYFTANPFLTADACEALVAAGVAFVGIDSLNIDDIGDMAKKYACDVVVVVPQDGAWNNDPFAASPDYRLAENRDGRWRIYVAVKADPAPR